MKDHEVQSSTCRADAGPYCRAGPRCVGGSPVPLASAAFGGEVAHGSERGLSRYGPQAASSVLRSAQRAAAQRQARRRLATWSRHRRRATTAPGRLLHPLTPGSDRTPSTRSAQRKNEPPVLPWRSLARASPRLTGPGRARGLVRVVRYAEGAHMQPLTAWCWGRVSTRFRCAVPVGERERPGPLAGVRPSFVMGACVRAARSPVRGARDAMPHAIGGANAGQGRAATR
jgi:hypothetical protein